MKKLVQRFLQANWSHKQNATNPRRTVANTNIQLKDFIYFDNPRMESFLAQLQEGLIREVMESRSSREDVEAKLKGGVPWLQADLAATGGITNSRNTSKILHNYLYTLLEKELGDRVIDIGESFTEEHWRTGNVHQKLGEKQTDFVKIHGRVRIFDFTSTVLQMDAVLKMMESFTQMLYWTPKAGHKNGVSNFITPRSLIGVARATDFRIPAA